MTSGEGSQIAAALKAIAIVAYFVVAIVWLPSRVLELGVMRDASDWLVDVVGTATWAILLGLGIWGLRRLQRRGFI